MNVTGEIRFGGGMKANLNGLSQVNIELTSRCEKSCHFCGHQDPEINKSLEYGDMDIGLLRKIHAELPGGIIVQFRSEERSCRERV